jgi:hypothetical protein
MKKTFMFICALAGAMMLPGLALAATPQQMLDAAVLKTNASAPFTMAGEVTIRTSQKALRERTPSQRAEVKFNLSQRRNGMSSEGSLAVKSFSAKMNGVEIPVTQNPAAVEWKVTDGKAYIRVSQASEAVLAALKLYGIDAQGAVGTWVEVDLLSLLSMVGPADLQNANDTAGIATSEASKFGDIKTLQVTRVERRWTENGVKMIRVRVRLNPAVINKAMAMDLKAVDPKASDAKAQRAAITARYAEMRKFATSFQIAVNMKVDEQSIDRIEMGYKRIDPMKECSKNKLGREVCKTTGSQTVEMNAGFFVRGASNAPVQAPANAVSSDVLLQGVLGQ